MGKKSKQKQKMKELSERMGMNVAKVSKLAKRSNKLTPCAVKSKTWEVSETCFNPFKKSMKMDGGYKDQYGKEVATAIGNSYLKSLTEAKEEKEILKEGNNEG